VFVDDLNLAILRETVCRLSDAASFATAMATEQDCMRLDLVQTIRFLILAWVVPAALSYMVYFGYASNISGHVFSEAGFAAIYDNGVFRYRVLGKTLLRFMHEAIHVLGLPTYAPEVLIKADPSLTAAFYSAYFYLNALLLCLTSSVLFVVISQIGNSATPEASDLVLIASVGLMVLSQFVVVPYDMLSYLFLAIAIYLVHAGPTDPRRLGALCVVMLMAALTRETAAIILAYYFAVHFDLLVHPSRAASRTISHRVALLILVACFLAVYIGLRLWFGIGESTVYHRTRGWRDFTENFTLVGGAFFVASVALALLHKRAQRTSMLFVIASAPYWIMIFAIANPREIRLWVPILFPLLLIQLRGDEGTGARQPTTTPA
jgi:hypothetical protein